MGRVSNLRDTTNEVFTNESGGGDLVWFIDLLGGITLFNDSLSGVSGFNDGSSFVGRLKDSSSFNTFFDVSSGGVDWGFDDLSFSHNSWFNNLRVGESGFNVSSGGGVAEVSSSGGGSEG